MTKQVKAEWCLCVDVGREFQYELFPNSLYFDNCNKTTNGGHDVMIMGS